MAEVLITLGIIGVVAAMTMTALIANTKKTEYSSRLKKFYSVMNQAILMSELDNGSAGDWLKDGGIAGDITDDDGNPDFGQNSEVIIKFINKYLKPYIKIININSSNRTVDDNQSYKGEAYMVFQDGSYVYLHNGNCIDFIYDVNGPKSPNEFGKDLYHFLLCSNEKCIAQPGYTMGCGKFVPNGYIKSADRPEALTKCKNTPKYCSELLQMDGFEFKEDYPHKL